MKIKYDEDTENLLKSFDELQDKMIESMLSEITQSMGIPSLKLEGSTSTSAVASTLGIVEHMQKMITEKNQQFAEMKSEIMKFSIPKYLVDDSPIESRYNDHIWKTRMLYGYFPIMKPMRTITIQVQKRKHRSKRINKKWLKKYGYKEIKKQVPHMPFVNVLA